MNQLAISFDLHKPEFTSLCRKTDPQTSIDAGRKVEREGTVARHERLICECLAAFGPQTAKEMEVLMAYNDDPQDRLTSVQISRRSTGLMEIVFSEKSKPPRCTYLTGTRNGFRIWSLIGGAA